MSRPETQLFDCNAVVVAADGGAGAAAATAALAGVAVSASLSASLNGDATLQLKQPEGAGVH